MIMSESGIGEILVRLGYLSEKDLEDGLKLQSEKGGRLGNLLVQSGKLSEKQFLKGLSVQLDIEFTERLDISSFDTQLVSRVPITFARQHNLIPVKNEGEKIVLACSDPLDLAAIDDLRILLEKELVLLLAPSVSIIDAINQIYNRAGDSSMQVADELGEIGEDALNEPIDLLDSTDEAPIIKLVNSLVFKAAKEGASDLHFETFEREIIVRYRVDGILYNILELPRRFQSSIISRIKIMAELNIAEKRLPQDGRIGLKIAGRDIDIRVSVVPTSQGERAVLRLLDKANILLSLEETGMEKEKLVVYEPLIRLSHGIILVTGPTGSGKTTTLYSSLSEINSPDKNIITIEDPIEYLLKGVGQIQVNPKIGLTFASGLRSILRQDPDVIMVGEIRDKETADISIHASLTGHLVFSTLHTNDAPGAITRLLDMDVEPFLISSSVVAVIAQRLVRKICPACKTEYSPSMQEREKVHPKLLNDNIRLYRGSGCSKCFDSGYKGRTGIYEILVLDDDLREMILARKDSGAIKRQAVSRGMTSLREDGANKIISGMTTIEEVVRVTQLD